VSLIQCGLVNLKNFMCSSWLIPGPGAMKTSVTLWCENSSPHKGGQGVWISLAIQEGPASSSKLGLESIKNNNHKIEIILIQNLHNYYYVTV
jgi:hypothetical protein